jgi:hypothetical protein
MFLNNAKVLKKRRYTFRRCRRRSSDNRLLCKFASFVSLALTLTSRGLLSRPQAIAVPRARSDSFRR